MIDVREDRPPVGAYLDHEFVDFGHQVCISMEWASYRMGVRYICGANKTLKRTFILTGRKRVIKHFWRYIGAA